MPGSRMFGYSVASVSRTRRRSAVVVLGLALAVAIVAAPAIALDSEIHTLVNRVLGSVPFDFDAEAITSDYDQAGQTAAALAGVTGAEPMIRVPASGTYALGGSANGTGTVQVPIAFDFVHGSFARFSGRFGLSGALALGPDEVAVTDRLAGQLGLSAGGQVTLLNRVLSCVSAGSCSVKNVTANFTVASVLTTTLASSGAALRAPLGTDATRDVVFASLDNVTSTVAALSLPVGTPPSVDVFIWADRGALIDAYDPDGTAEHVLHLQREIISALSNWGFRVFEGRTSDTQTPLSQIVGLVNDSMGFQRALLALFSLPTMLLAFLFTRVSFESGLAKRRREVGVLRSRGSTARVVVSGLLVEALLLGAMAAVLGLAISVAVSRVFLGFVNASFPGGEPIPLTDVAVSIWSILIAVGIAAAAAFFVAYGPVQRLSSTRITHALRVTSSIETSVDYGEARFLLLVLGGLAGVFFVIALAGSFTQGGLVSFLLGGIVTVLLVLAPILLILGVARYVTLGTNRPYRAVARLVRPWLGELDFLVVEGVRRAPRRSSTLAVLVAFALAFAMFIVSLAGIVASQNARVAHTVVGADLAFTTQGLDASSWANLTGLPGVATAVPVYYLPSNYGALAAFNATDYLTAVPDVDAYYFTEGSPADLATLFGAGGALANAAGAKRMGLHLGDPVILNILVGTGRSAHIYTVHVKITGVVLALPGLQQSGAEVDTDPLLFVDTETLTAWGLTGYPSVPPGERVLVRTASGADPHAVAKAIEDRWPVTATVYADLLAAKGADPFQAALLGQLYTDAGLSVLVAVLAVSVMAYASAADREGEFATVLARGVTRRQLNMLLFGEALAVGLVGALPAVPMVLIFLWAFLRASTFVAPLALPLEFQVPGAAWILLAGALGALLVGSLLAGVRLRWMNVPKVLKLRGA